MVVPDLSGLFLPTSPLHAVLYGLCLLSVFLLAFRGRWADRVISAVLGVTWAALALSFFQTFAAAPRVRWVAALFLAQALIFVWEGLLRGRLDYRPRTAVLPVLGALFLFYSLVLAPWLTAVLEANPFNLPILGIPFDVALFSFGLLLFLREGFPRYVLVLPLAWAAAGGMAAFQVGAARDWGLLAALVAGVSLALPERRRVADVEGNERLETWYEHAARHQRTCGRSTLLLVLATCLLGFGVAAGEEPLKPLEVSAAVLAALSLVLWLSLPAWYSAGFRLLAWEATCWLRVVRRGWNWLTARWVGVIVLSVLTVWAGLTIYQESAVPAVREISSRNLIIATLAVLLFYAIYRARHRIVIEEFVDYTRDAEVEGSGKGLASRLRNELASIATLYRTIDEAMPTQRGQVVRVTVGVEDVVKPLEDVVGPDAVAEVGGWKFSLGSFLRLFGRLVRGPRITGSLHRDGDDLLLVADLSGGGMSGSWRVSSREQLPQDQPPPRTATVYWLAEQLAYRIITNLGNVGSPRWEAVRSFTHGLRSYRKTQMSRGDISPELREAEREFISALSFDESFSQCHYNLGVVYQAMRVYESAEAALRHILEQNPNWAEAYYALATVYFDSGQHEKAGIFARKMIEVRPGDSRAWNLNGTARYTHRHEEARRQDALQQVYEGPAWEEIARSFEIACAVAWRDLCSAALRSPSSTLAKERQNAVKCATNLGIVRNFGRDAEGVQAILEQAFRLAPHDSAAHLIRGESLFDERRWPASRAELFQAFGDEPVIDDHVERWIYLLGVHLASADDAGRQHACDTILDHAVPPEEMVLASRSDEVAEQDRGSEYGAHLDHFETLLNVVDRKLGGWPDPFRSLLRSVDFLRWLELEDRAAPPPPLEPGEQEWAGAQELIRTARLALPDHPGQARAGLARAVAILERRHARQIARQGLRSLQARACLLEAARGGDPKLLMEAMEHAEASVAQEPGSAARRWILGDVFADLGDFEEASNEREMALNLGSSCHILDDPAALSRIARDYLRLAGGPAPDARLHRGLRFFKRILQFVESRRSNKSEAQFAAHAAAHFWVGRFHCELGEHDKGIDHLLVARSMTFRPIEIGLRLGNVYFRRRSFRDAQVAFATSALATRANGLARRNGTPLRDEAPAEVEAELLLSWAMLYADRGIHLGRAKRLCERAAKHIRAVEGPRRGELRALHQECFGWILFRKEDFDGSLKVLKRTAQATGNARLYTRLAQVYEAQGGREALRNARETRERARAANGFASVRAQGVFDAGEEARRPGVETPG